MSLRQKLAFACDRLEDIINSYTLYRDLVITDKFGFIIANANKETRASVLGLRVDDEVWFSNALDTKDGTQYFAQDVTQSRVESTRSLVYSTAVREKSDNYGKVLGAMGVFFDFQDEATMILEDYIPREEDGALQDGWYSFFTNEQGNVIASSDNGIISPGHYAHMPRKHRGLRDGSRPMTYAIVEGVESVIFSARTDGYLDYEGLGWSSHLVVPKGRIFDSGGNREEIGIELDGLMHSKLIPEINKETFSKVQEDKESIQLISLNGIVFASKLGKRGLALGPIFDQIKTTGEFATSKMEYLLTEMAFGELELNLKALEIFSQQAIDLIDRNLFERSADIRWWSTDEYFWRALQDPSPEHAKRAAKRLEVINGSYTMYRNLVLANPNGQVVASARSEDRHRLRDVSVSDEDWFLSAMRTESSSEYSVQDVKKSHLESRKEGSLIYSGGVRENGARVGDTIGVVGILFDWDTEAGKILGTCLPRDKDGAFIEGCAAFYTNGENVIIESTDGQTFPVGDAVSLPKKHLSLSAGGSVSGLHEHQGVKFILGSSKTKGYREYAGLGWCAHVVRPI